MKRTALFLGISLVIGLAQSAHAQFSVNDLMALKRVSDPQLSPDGRYVVYTVGVVNVADNRVVNHIFRINTDGSDMQQLTTGTASHSSPRWSPDGKHIAFTTGGQIWVMENDGDDKEQVTELSTGAGGPVWSGDGRWIAFTSDVYPECRSDECNKAEEEKAANSKVTAKVTDRLLFKHWNEWRDRKRTHVFVVPSSGGAAREITPGDYDSPPYGASTGVDYAFSPDSTEIVFLRNPDKVEATSTNSDIYIMPLAGGTPRNITAANKGYDAGPVYTADGKYILFRSQATATFESDRWRLMRYNRQSGETVELSRGFDDYVDDIALSPDGDTVYFTSVQRGRTNLYSVPLEVQRTSASIKRHDLGHAGSVSGLSIHPDGRTIVFAAGSMSSPPEIVTTQIGGSSAITNLSRANASPRFTEVEEIEWRGAVNTSNHGFIVKPANFDPARKYPMIVLIHGGPQGAWNDSWSTRWNPQLWANQGYVIFLPNPRGSTGYGQKFINEISGDWGGKVFVDLKNGVAEMARKPYVDKARIGAAGASYGGYMVDWILGHNNDPRFKFKALMSHAGVYNLESMATSTEEIWFVNWDFKGMPWENPAVYNRWSPHKFVRNFNTPTLVTAGELDYRVPVDQSLQLFTTLQLRGVDSRLVVFPDEGHWIMKPQNSAFWHKEVFDWFGKHLKP